MAFGNFRDFREGFEEDSLRGPDDQAKQFYKSRDIQNLDDDAIRLEKYFAEHPLLYRSQELLHGADTSHIKNPEQRLRRDAEIEARQSMGMGPKQNMAGRLGQLGGAAAYDLMHDKSRGLYWLLNAAQATGSVISELAVNSVNPDLFGTRAVKTPDGKPVSIEDLTALSQITSELNGKPLATAIGPKGDNGRPTLVANSDVRKGRKTDAMKAPARLRNYRSGTVTALGIPAGFAINQGLGLMTPFGGYEGYEAALPSEDDPTKTSNVVGEIAAKYIMGRTGNLLPYDEFSKVRPDVSKGEYNAYKAFKYDKKADLNPFDDGQMTVPTGIIKTNSDGIHGAEVQFLGRSLPVNTALIPFASAVGGAMLGVKKRTPVGQDPVTYVDRRAGRRGVIGGAIGTAAGMALGNLLEGERRRRNQAENGVEHDSTGMM